jgi:hypothetical protein
MANNYSVHSCYFLRNAGNYESLENDKFMILSSKVFDD